MPIGKVCVYRLLFVISFVCLYVYAAFTDFSAEDKASGVNFCTVVYRRPEQGISHFAELCSPRSSPKALMGYMRVCNLCGGLIIRVAGALTDSSSALATRRIGMCGYTAVPEDGRTCLLFKNPVYNRLLLSLNVCFICAFCIVHYLTLLSCIRVTIFPFLSRQMCIVVQKSRNKWLRHYPRYRVHFYHLQLS